MEVTPCPHDERCLRTRWDDRHCMRSVTERVALRDLDQRLLRVRLVDLEHTDDALRAADVDPAPVDLHRLAEAEPRAGGSWLACLHERCVEYQRITWLQGLRRHTEAAERPLVGIVEA